MVFHWSETRTLRPYTRSGGLRKLVGPSGEDCTVYILWILYWWSFELQKLVFQELCFIALRKCVFKYKSNLTKKSTTLSPSTFQQSSACRKKYEYTNAVRKLSYTHNCCSLSSISSLHPPPCLVDLFLCPRFGYINHCTRNCIILHMFVLITVTRFSNLVINDASHCNLHPEVAHPKHNTKTMISQKWINKRQSHVQWFSSSCCCSRLRRPHRRTSQYILPSWINI